MKITEEYGWSTALEGSPEDWAYMAKQAERATITETIYVEEPFGRTVRVVPKRIIRTKHGVEIQHEAKLAAWGQTLRQLDERLRRLHTDLDEYANWMANTRCSSEYDQAYELHEDTMMVIDELNKFRLWMIEHKPTLNR